MYRDGRGGVAQDDSQAVRWYRQAADAGDAKAMFFLGSFYEHGGASGEYAHGSLAAHPDEAMRWYRKSANLGYQLAKTRIEYLEKAAEAIARVTHDVRTDRVALGFRRRPQPSRQRPRASR